MEGSIWHHLSFPLDIVSMKKQKNFVQKLMFRVTWFYEQIFFPSNWMDPFGLHHYMCISDDHLGTPGMGWLIDELNAQQLTYLQVCHESWCLGLSTWCLGYNIYYGAITFPISWGMVCKIPILFIHLNVKYRNAFGFKHAWKKSQTSCQSWFISSSFQNDKFGFDLLWCIHTWC
jgi:hypothetical protein